MSMISEQRWVDGAPITDNKIPSGPIEDAWDTRRFDLKLVWTLTALPPR